MSSIEANLKSKTQYSSSFILETPKFPLVLHITSVLFLYRLQALLRQPAHLLPQPARHPLQYAISSYLKLIYLDDAE
jgi:hypothetical protein